MKQLRIERDYLKFKIFETFHYLCNNFTVGLCKAKLN